METPSEHTDRVPSRVGHRRPPLQRSNASYNLFPELPPICAASEPLSESELAFKIATCDDETSSSSESEENIKVHLAPLSPPSPPSPTSSCSQSSSSSPVSPPEQYEWEFFHDGFPPPPLAEEPLVTPWPATPNPQLDSQSLDDEYQLTHHGLSNNALYELKASLWIRRQWFWWYYEDHCRRIDSMRSNPSDDGIPLSFFYPHPPSLPPSRQTPWVSANGRMLPTAERVRAHSPQQPDSAWKTHRAYYSSIYPRAGDIADIRDPSCESMDRDFFSVPLNKIKQLVYLGEMDVLHSDNGQCPRHFLAPPSPLSHGWTPDSPMSAYSQDSPALPSPLTSHSPAPVSHADSLHYPRNPPLDTCWKSRWTLVEKSIPPSPPPPTACQSTLPYLQASPPPLPLRPGTPVPDGNGAALPLSQGGLINDDPDTEGGDNAYIPTVSPSIMSPDVDDHVSTEISVHLPAPIPVLAPISVALQAPPQTPSLHRFSSPIPDYRGEEPVVRLPPRSVTPAPLSTSPPFVPESGTSSVIAELRHEEADENDSGVWFSIQRPPSRCGSPQLSFIALEA